MLGIRIKPVSMWIILLCNNNNKNNKGKCLWQFLMQSGFWSELKRVGGATERPVYSRAWLLALSRRASWLSEDRRGWSRSASKCPDDGGLCGSGAGYWNEWLTGSGGGSEGHGWCDNLEAELSVCGALLRNLAAFAVGGCDKCKG